MSKWLPRCPCEGTFSKAHASAARPSRREKRIRDTRRDGDPPRLGDDEVLDVFADALCEDARAGEADIGQQHEEFLAAPAHREIRSTLREVGANVVSGPSQLGVYRLRLAPGADLNAAIGRLRGEGRGVAAFAEPARG